MTPHADDDRMALDLMIRGFEVSRMLRLVADLGVADRIAPDGRIEVGALAAACGVQTLPLTRVLRALAAFGVFGLGANGHVAHTARSRLLRTDTPNSLHHAARFWAAPGSWAAWSKLDVAMTGGVPHVAAWDMARFDYLRTHQDEARAFDAMMANFPDDRHGAFAEAYDFSAARLIVDIGGGSGGLLRQILSRFAAPRGLLFDREDVVSAVLAGDLMDGRITAAGGSFFEAVPRGADLYTITRVLHDWADADCLRILRACRAAMPADALLLIGEHLLEPDPARGRPVDYLVDIQMMAMFGAARERTEQDFAALLAEAGFAARRVIPTRASVAIIEAAPL